MNIVKIDRSIHIFINTLFTVPETQAWPKFTFASKNKDIMVIISNGIALDYI